MNSHVNFLSPFIFLKHPNCLNDLSNLEISIQLQKGFEPKVIGTLVHGFRIFVLAKIDR